MTPHGHQPFQTPHTPGQQFGPAPLPYPVAQDDAVGYVDSLPAPHPLTGATPASALNPMPSTAMSANPLAMNQMSARPYRPGPRDPYTGEEYSDKSAVTGGLLQLFLGGFGAGRFYLGDHRRAAAQLALTIACFAAPWAFSVLLFLAVTGWAIADAIIIFTGNARDERGRRVT